jgi:photosystem II stability/assembly factor-like uncharacterized protein
MDELIRSKMHEALDAIPPPPGLRPLGSMAADDRSMPSRQRPRLEWASGVIAALLAVAIVAGLLVSRGLHVSIPSGPGLHEIPPRPMSGMVSPTTGWVTGPGGHVFRTTDGGFQWKDVTPADYRSNSIFPYFFDGERAWITEESGASSIVVFRTSDGGSSWQRGAPITVAGFHARGPISLYFFDPTHGWLLGSSLSQGPIVSFDFEFLYGTADGGSHWQLLADTKTHAPACPWTAVAFSSRTTGWITTFCRTSGGKPDLLVSHDRGATWQTQSLPVTLADGTALFPPTFFDAAHAILAAYPTVLDATKTGGSVEAILATSDGGQTWGKLGLPGKAVLAGSFVDAQHGWVIAGSSDLLNNDSSLTDVSLPLFRTSDGGLTWTAVKNDLTLGTSHGRIHDVYFVNLQVGFAVATQAAAYAIGSRTLFVTTDGGGSWREVGAIPT